MLSLTKNYNYVNRTYAFTSLFTISIFYCFDYFNSACRLEKLVNEKENLILLGDFNIAPSDEDVHDPLLWQDKILCSSEERRHFEEIKALGLLDTFRHFKQDKNLFSWWDYRAGGFPRNRGLRIDLILASLTMKGNLKTSILCPFKLSSKGRE
ncbi:MAG TPA: hypothetical protein EYQ86_00025 [Bacteroidetes bacterium]|nr:hypothetical protein [Bacteroidota bacterium]